MGLTNAYHFIELKFLHQLRRSPAIVSLDAHRRMKFFFGGCTSLYQIEVPSSVEGIGSDGFFQWPSLRIVVIHGRCQLKENQGLRWSKSFIRPRPSPIGNKMKLRVHFEIQSSKMRHIGTQCGFFLLPSSILSQKYRRCHFTHQITGYERTRVTSVSDSSQADHY
jgi:hypothetical protein